MPVTPREGAIAPVMTLAGHHYIELAAWASRPVPDGNELLAFTQGPIAPVPSPPVEPWRDRYELHVQAVDTSPPWPALVGTALPAFDASGHRCDARVGALALLAYSYSTSLDGGVPPVLAAEVVVASGCTPAVVTNVPAPRFFSPAGEATAAEARQVRAALRDVAPPWTREGDGERSLVRFTDGAGRTLVLATDEQREPREGGCGEDARGFRALLELRPGGAPVLLGTADAAMGDAPLVALFAGAGPAPMMAVLGPATFDLGGDTAHDVASVVPLTSPAGEVRRLRFLTYAGCD